MASCTRGNRPPPRKGVYYARAVRVDGVAGAGGGRVYIMIKYRLSVVRVWSRTDATTGAKKLVLRFRATRIGTCDANGRGFTMWSTFFPRFRVEKWSKGSSGTYYIIEAIDIYMCVYLKRLLSSKINVREITYSTFYMSLCLYYRARMTLIYVIYFVSNMIFRTICNLLF